MKFQHEQNLPTAFFCLVDDCNGVNVKQFNDSILMSSKDHMKQMLKTHGWDKESPDCLKPCKDGETKGHQVSSMPADCLSQMHKEEGCKEGTVDHMILEKKMGFQC